MLSLIARLAVLGVASAMPTSLNPLSARQSDDSLFMCRGPDCSDCPLYFSAGTGWPDCPAYTGDQLTDNGFPVLDSGKIQIFIDVPPVDQGCAVLVRTPVLGGTENCGGNVIVAQGATCAPIVIDNTFMVSFCCGTGDCSDAGAPTKRDFSGSLAARQGSGVLLLHDKDGNVIEPHAAQSLQGRSASPESDAARPAPISPLKSRNPKAAASKKLSKRDCSDFTVTNGPYTEGGTNYPISEPVTCSPTSTCSATLGETVTEETSFSVEVSVSDPLGIVSASAGFEFSQSVSQTFEGQFEFGEGETGYVVFIPYITCVEGYFTGDCDDDGVQTTVCGARAAGEGAIAGEQRAVIIRG